MIDEKEAGQIETSDQNYIEALTEMRNNTVPKADYEKVLAENKQLLDALVQGQTIDVPKEEPPVDVNKLRNDLFNKEMTNLDYASTALALRNELIKRGERDPFIPYGHEYSPDENDASCAQKAADTLQHCIDVANGNPTIFQNELQRCLVDTIPAIMKNRR